MTGRTGTETEPNRHQPGVKHEIKPEDMQLVDVQQQQQQQLRGSQSEGDYYTRTNIWFLFSINYSIGAETRVALVFVSLEWGDWLDVLPLPPPTDRFVHGQSNDDRIDSQWMKEVSIYSFTGP